MIALPRTAHIRWLGRISYAACFELQQELHARVAAGNAPDTLLLLEHPPVVTLGRNYHPSNLLLTPEEYERRGIEVVTSDRGGDVTFHGPGQLVGYPIFNLSNHGRDLHMYLRNVEQAIIHAIREFRVEGKPWPAKTGVWVQERKICAIGIKVSRWTSMHGFALNVEQVPEGFGTIVPCGIRTHGVTSLSDEVGRPVKLEEAIEPVKRAFERVFSLTLLQADEAMESR